MTVRLLRLCAFQLPQTRVISVPLDLVASLIKRIHCLLAPLYNAGRLYRIWQGDAVHRPLAHESGPPRACNRQQHWRSSTNVSKEKKKIGR